MIDQKGFSVLEVILAASLFVIFATAAIIVVVQGYNANRQGTEYTIANQYAAEGIEAVKSIKNQAYTNLVNSAGTGLTRNASNVWAFSGANNTFAHSASDNFIRSIKVESVNRDATPPNGNIVASGGTADPDTKKITSTVTWNFSSAIPETLSLVTYLSDWRKAISSVNNQDGMLVYGDTVNTPTFPKTRTYLNSSNGFTAEANATVAGSAVGKTFKIKTSPTRSEAIAGYIDNTGNLQIMCYDGSSGTWTNDWSTTVGGTGNTQRFGLAYETQSGEALIVYSRNIGSSAELGYRTKPAGSCGGWSAETTYTTLRTTGIVQWIRMEGSPLAASNNIAVAWSDANGKLSIMQWNGSNFTALPEAPATALESTTLDTISANGDSLAFDIAYESITGNLVLVWGVNDTAAACTAGSNCIKYTRYTGSWLNATAVPLVADSGTNIDLSANPNTNEMVFGAIDNGPATANTNDLSVAYWSGSAWTGLPNKDNGTGTPAAGTKQVASGWLISGATTRSIVVYADTTTVISYVTGNAATFSNTTTFSETPAFTNPQKWLDLQMDPKNKDRAMLTYSDNAAPPRLYAKRVTMSSTGSFSSPNGFTNSDGSAALDTNLGQAAPGAFSFAYWRFP